MEWINFKDEKPGINLAGKEILILVNGCYEICYITDNRMIYINIDKFIYCPYTKEFKSDFRFGIPTHWLLLPEPPHD